MFNLSRLLTLLLLLVGVLLLTHFISYSALQSEKSQLRSQYRLQLTNTGERLAQTIESTHVEILEIADMFLEDHYRLRPVNEVGETIVGVENGIQLALLDLLHQRHETPASDFPFILQSHLQTAMEEQRASMEVITESSVKRWLMAVPLDYRNTISEEEQWVAVAWLPVERLEAAIRTESGVDTEIEISAAAGMTSVDQVQLGRESTEPNAVMSSGALIELMQEISGSPRILIGRYGMAEHNPLFVAKLPVEGWILKISPAERDLATLQRGTSFLWLGLAVMVLALVVAINFRPRLFGIDAEPLGQRRSDRVDRSSSEVARPSSVDLEAESNIDDQADDTGALLGEESIDSVALGVEEETEERRRSELNQEVDIPSSLFRAYDIRGDSELLLRQGFPELVGKALGTLALDAGESALHLCRDGRLSSEELHSRFCEGVLSSGCDVIDLGVGPTPLLSFAVATNNQCGSGAMITASHNPAHHNGFKLILDHKILFGEELQRLINRMHKGGFRSGAGDIHAIDFVSEYLRYLREDILVEGEPHVVIDGSNGAAGPLAIEALEQVGCKVSQLFCDIDGTFPNHSPDNIKSENLTDLIRIVTETEADIGFAFDGDGDRIIAVTSSGRIVWPDQLMVLFSEDILLTQPAATIVYDVKCTRLLASSVGVMGGRPLLTRSGRSYVADALLQHEAPFGGEYSGHLFFADRWFGTDDGIYAAARLVELVSGSEKSLDEMLDQLPVTYATEEIAIPIEEERKEALLYAFRRLIEKTSGRILSIDGIRVEFPAGWGLLRSSNTSANLSLRFEASSPEALQELQALFREKLLLADPDVRLPF